MTSVPGPSSAAQSEREVERVEPVELLAWLRDLLAQVGRVERERAKGFMACCPAHPDRNPSLSVTALTKRVVLHCFAGCEESAVWDALGIDGQALFYEHFRPELRPVSPVVRAVPREAVKLVSDRPARAYKTMGLPKVGRPVATYEYADEAGEVRYVVARYLAADGGKTFRQFTPSPSGGWFRQGPPEAARVLYRLPALREGIEAGATVYLVEGEKDAEAGAALDVEGVVFTSAAGGAKAHWLGQYTGQLAGAELVRIVADADEPGRAYAARVRGELVAAGLVVEVVESDRAKDLADHLAAGGTLDDLVPVELPELVDVGAGGGSGAGGGGGDVPGGGGDDEGDGGGPRTVYRRGPEYVVERGQIWRVTWKEREDRQKVRELGLILGCEARIVRTVRCLVLDETQDNPAGGAISQYVVEAVHPTTGEVRELVLPLKDWRDGSWLEQLWPDVRFRKDRQARQEVLTAVSSLSVGAAEHTVHAATGWTELEGRRAYVHAGGAITADGVLDVETDLMSKLRPLAMEAPSTAEQVRADLAESLGMLTWDWLPARIGFVLAGVAYRAILPGNGLTALMVAPPGSGKTAVAMIAGEHFAPRMNQANKCFLSMAALGATAKVAQLVLHRAKDALMVVDDFPPKVNSRDARAGADQSAIIRAVYDQASRDALTQDRRAVPGPHPRCAVLSSAEYAPSDTGARERSLVVPMPWGVVPPVEDIARAQSPDAARARSRFMAWVIQQTATTTHEGLEDWLAQAQHVYAAAVRGQGYGIRTAEHVAKLMAGWQWVLRRLVAADVFTEAEAEEWWTSRVWPAALEAAEADTDPEGDMTPADQLVRLIGEALTRGHVADYATPDTPPVDLDPRGCGWSSVGGVMGAYRPSGDCLGWVRGSRVWLHPSLVFAAVQKVAADEGTHLSVLSVAAASSVLAGAGLGMASDPGKNSHRVRVAGKRERVWDLPLSLFWGEDDDERGPADPATPEGAPPASDGPTSPPLFDGEPTAAGSAPKAPTPATSPERGTCSMCGEAMTRVNGGEYHPSCDPADPMAPARGEEPGSEGRARPATSGEARWRAAEVVLTADEAILPDGTRLELPTGHAGDVAAWAAGQRIGHGGGKSRPEPAHVWLSREFLDAHGLPVRDRGLVDAGRLSEADERLSAQMAEAHAEHWFFTAAGLDGFETGRTTLSGWTRLWKKGTKASAVITSPEWVGLGSLAEGDPDPEHLARRLGLWTYLVGHPLVINPGVTFKSLCRLPAAELPDLPWARMAADFMWQRPATGKDRAQEFVHAYDRRKSYLAACSTAEASGSLVHVVAPELDKKRPGFWRVTAATWPSGELLPDPRLDYEGTLCEWVATPTLALLMEHGPVEVAEAWLYAGATSRVVERAYAAFRAGLERAEGWEQSEDVRAVVAAMKGAYRAGIGQMAMTRDEGTVKRGHRPDVRATIIATHRANSLRAMLHAGAGGVWPLVMARADSVVFASNEPDAAAAWPGRPQDASELLGKYKAAGTQSMAEWERLALVEPVTPSRSIWAVTEPERAARMLVEEQTDWTNLDDAALAALVDELDEVNN